MIDRNLLQTEAAAFDVKTDETALERIDLYSEELVRVNEYLNLTAITEPTEVLYKHWLDSLTVLRYAKPKSGAKCMDVGTGAGFPGAALLIARPDLQMTLLDSTRKKLTFIAETLDKIGLSAEILHQRAEEAGRMPAYREQFDLVTARAVAALRELCEYCLPFVKIGGTFAAMKSVRSDEEIVQAQKAMHLLGGQIESVETCTLPYAGERTLILIKKCSQTPSKYPRPSAKIAKQPLI